jgi:hypothetical protein
MPSNLCPSGAAHPSQTSEMQPEVRWHTFEEILDRLHAQGIYIHAEQLAEFLLLHGLPVHLRYVPSRLHQKAHQVNQYYQGDMARLVEEFEPPCWEE